MKQSVDCPSITHELKKPYNLNSFRFSFTAYGQSTKIGFWKKSNSLHIHHD